MMWALVGLGALELLAVHLFVSLKWPWLAWPLSGLTLLSLGWMVLLIRSFRRRPHQLGAELLQLRLGNLRSFEVPRTSIGTTRGVRDSAEVKAKDTADFHLLSYPNRIVELSRPLRFGRREVARIALALDEPEAFDLALQS